MQFINIAFRDRMLKSGYKYIYEYTDEPSEKLGRHRPVTPIIALCLNEFLGKWYVGQLSNL